MNLTLTASELRVLVQPVIPLASSDAMLPVLNAVLIQSDGCWLAATATDRYRVGIKRIKKVVSDDDPTADWPPFHALIPLRSLRSILATHKPRRGFDPAITLTVDSDLLTVEAVGAFTLFDSARMSHVLERGKYPDVRKIITDCLDTPECDRAQSADVSPSFIADFRHCGSAGMRIVMGRPHKPVVVMDGDGFIGALMPRSVSVTEDWGDLLGSSAMTEAVAS